MILTKNDLIQSYCDDIDMIEKQFQQEINLKLYEMFSEAKQNDYRFQVSLESNSSQIALACFEKVSLPNSQLRITNVEHNGNSFSVDDILEVDNKTLFYVMKYDSVLMTDPQYFHVYARS